MEASLPELSEVSERDGLSVWQAGAEGKSVSSGPHSSSQYKPCVDKETIKEQEGKRSELQRRRRFEM